MSVLEKLECHRKWVVGWGGEGSKKEKVAGRIVRGGVGYHWAERCKKKGECLCGGGGG